MTVNRVKSVIYLLRREKRISKNLSRQHNQERNRG